jgi:polyhydroxyalkanoate synthesis regulator phasin
MGKRTLIASAGAAVALAAGAGGAYAAGGFGSGPGPGGPGPGVGIVVGSDEKAGGDAIASYLGLTQEELRAQLEAGKTLAQIATAQGKSVSGLEAVMYAQVESKLDQAVTDGKLTAAQEQTMLADLKSNLDEFVNHSGPPGGGPPGGGGVRILATAVAGYLGLSETELKTQVESGKSLAQIATAQGKSVEGLKAAIVADAKSKLDQAVSAGKITAAQAKTMLAELTSHVDDLVNLTGPLRVQARAA